MACKPGLDLPCRQSLPETILRNNQQQRAALPHACPTPLSTLSTHTSDAPQAFKDKAASQGEAAGQAIMSSFVPQQPAHPADYVKRYCAELKLDHTIFRACSDMALAAKPKVRRQGFPKSGRKARLFDEALRLREDSWECVRVVCSCTVSTAHHGSWSTSLTTFTTPRTPSHPSTYSHALDVTPSHTTSLHHLLTACRIAMA